MYIHTHTGIYACKHMQIHIYIYTHVCAFMSVFVYLSCISALVSARHAECEHWWHSSCRLVPVCRTQCAKPSLHHVNRSLPVHVGLYTLHIQGELRGNGYADCYLCQNVVNAVPLRPQDRPLSVGPSRSFSPALTACHGLNPWGSHLYL